MHKWVTKACRRDESRENRGWESIHAELAWRTADGNTPSTRRKKHSSHERKHNNNLLPAQVDIWSGFPGCKRHTEPLGSGESVVFGERSRGAGVVSVYF